MSSVKHNQGQSLEPVEKLWFRAVQKGPDARRISVVIVSVKTWPWRLHEHEHVTRTRIHARRF